MELAIAAAVAGTAMSAGSTIMAGREASRAASFEAQQKTREGEEYKTAAAQAEARRREGLTSSLETIMSIRAGRGVGEHSPTADASFNEIISDESRDVRVERLNYLSRAEQARLASSMSARKGKMSLIASYLDAGSQVASTGSAIASGRIGGGRYGTSGNTGKAGY